MESSNNNTMLFHDDIFRQKRSGIICSERQIRRQPPNLVPWENSRLARTLNLCYIGRSIFFYYLGPKDCT